MLKTSIAFSVYVTVCLYVNLPKGLHCRHTWPRFLPMPDLSVQRRGTTAALKANKAKQIKASDRTFIRLSFNIVYRGDMVAGKGTKQNPQICRHDLQIKTFRLLVLCRNGSTFVEQLPWISTLSVSTEISSKAKGQFKPVFTYDTSCHHFHLASHYLRRGPAVERETQPASSITIPPKASFITKDANLQTRLFLATPASSVELCCNARNYS